MSRDEITSRLAALQQQYPQVFQIEGSGMKDVTPNDTSTELLDYVEGRTVDKG